MKAINHHLFAWLAGIPKLQHEIVSQKEREVPVCLASRNFTVCTDSGKSAKD